jgi:hypothetical protein
MREEVPSAARSDWSAERSALAADALNQGGLLRLRVHGESMLPTIWPGDVVVLPLIPPIIIPPVIPLSTGAILESLQ